MSHRYPELLDDLAANAAKVLCANGLPKDRADALGSEIAECIRVNWGGQQIYVPMGVLYQANTRDEKLYRKFTGDNHGELAAEFGISVQHVYRVIKKMAGLGQKMNGRNDG